MTGHTVQVASSGQDGLALARTFRPHIILCDIGLPDLDGYEVARALRRDVGLTKACLIAVTGYAQDEVRAGEAGFNAYMLKPIDFAVLERLIRATCVRQGVGLIDAT